jgi:phenylalanyl-tRNA synthetase alpha chain
MLLRRGLHALVRGRCCLSTLPLPRALPELDAPHPLNNVPPSIRATARAPSLLATPGHPLAALKRAIAAHFAAPLHPAGVALRAFEAELSPVVSVAQNFDELLTPAGHVSRRPSDTFYVDDARLLRCHMTAHQTSLLRAGHRAFLMIGDVYRRDTVDATHAPVFHQVDGVRVWRAQELPEAERAALARGDRGPAEALVVADLRAALEGLARRLFGAGAQLRWVDAHFPFTHPSLELEVLWEGEWLELLGCGVIRSAILDASCGGEGAIGWAFGLGLERLAMVLHGIPDIRLFWSSDPRFLRQFSGERVAADAAAGRYVKFEPFSRHPACFKDLAFWVPAGMAVVSEADADAQGLMAGGGGGAAAPSAAPVFHENDLHAAVREAAGQLVESVQRVDKFVHPKTGRTSLCFRVNYRAPDRTLTNEEVNAVMARVRSAVAALGVELR